MFNKGAVKIFKKRSSVSMATKEKDTCGWKKPGADLGFFVPQSKFFGRRGVIGAWRGLDWALSGGVGAK
jgi:hypothetical protein